MDTRTMARIDSSQETKRVAVRAELLGCYIDKEQPLT
jgi:hypothetical protein